MDMEESAKKAAEHKLEPSMHCHSMKRRLFDGSDSSTTHSRTSRSRVL